MSASIFDEILKQVHRTEARALTVSDEMLKALAGARATILGKEAELRVRLLTGRPWEEEALYRRKAFLQAQRQEIERIVAEIFQQFEPELVTASEDVMTYVQAQTAKQIPSKTVPIELGTLRLDTGMVRSWVEVSTVDGLTLSEWLNRMTATTADTIVRAGREAMIQGFSVQKTAQLLRQRGIEGTRPQIEALSRTYLLSASNYAREQAIEGLGADLDFSWLYVATLDGRTCLICGADDGKLFKKNAVRPSVPRHPNCRCTYIPIFDNESLAGVTRPTVKHDSRTVHHRDGSTSTKFSVPEGGVDHVPATESYSQWISRQVQEDPAFVRQVLGKTRFDLLRKGEISLSKMVVDGRIKKLTEL